MAEPSQAATGGGSSSTPSSVASALGIEDPRVEIVADYLLRHYKLKTDRWVKFYNNLDNKMALMEFFTLTEKDIVIFFCTSSSIDFAFKWPSDGHQTFTYFGKRNPKNTITKDNFREEIFYGDIFPNLLDTLSIFLNKVVERIAMNSLNTSKWPNATTEDVRYHIQTLKNIVDITSSKSKGHTLLRIPNEFDNFEYSGGPNSWIDRRLLHEIETIIVMWTSEIQEVLKYHCADPILEGKNPNPNTEIKYWQLRSKDFDQLYQQLINPRVKMMAQYLRDGNSVYFQAFKDLYSCVVGALTEANDNVTYLVPFQYVLDTIETVDLDACESYLIPLMYTVGLVWVHSNYYNTPERITVLLQMLCNYVIDMIDGYLTPEEMFKGDIAETLPLLKVAEKVMSSFLSSFDTVRGKLSSMFSPGIPVRLWDFPPDIIFSRFIKVHERLKVAYYLMDTNINFMKLEKVEFGGIKGNSLGEEVMTIFQEFDEAFKLFTESKNNPLNPSDPGFMTNFDMFNMIMADFDRRLATTVLKGYFDCSGLESIYKLIEMMGPLLERELIMKDFDDKYPEVVVLMHKALDICFELYDNQMTQKRETGKMWVHKNMPPMAGAMYWSKEIYARVHVYVESYMRIEHPVKNTETYQHVLTRLEDLKVLLNQSDAFYYNRWLSTVDDICSFNMSQPLLVRDNDTRLLSVNFDDKLAAVLKEMKYLKLRNKEIIPEMPEGVFERRDMLFNYYTSLILTMQLYNKLITDSLDVEKPLIERHMANIDKQITPALTDLSWKMNDIWNYITDTLNEVKNLTNRVQQTKDNVEKLKNIMATWSTTPLFERKEKQDNMLGLNDRADTLKKRYAEISNAGMELHSLMEDNMELFDAEKKSPAWQNYVTYLDEMVIEGFANIAACSLRYFLENTNPDKTTGPLFEILLELHVPKMVFIPDIETGSPGGFWDLIDSLLLDIYTQASLVPRLKSSAATTYQNCLETRPEVAEMKLTVEDAVEKVLAELTAHRDSLNQYSSLWGEDRQEYMKQFLKYNHKPTQEELSLAGEEGLPECSPTLAQFKEMIDYYEALYVEIEQLQTIQVFSKWLRVDARAFKQGLLNVIKRWSQMFKQHLIDRVTGGTESIFKILEILWADKTGDWSEKKTDRESLLQLNIKEDFWLDGLQEFIVKTNEGLAREPKEGDYKALVDIMGLLNAVRDRQAETDTMFEPLKQTIDMLKTCGVEMSEKVYNQLEELPDKWVQLKKKVMLMKQTVVPLQQNQVAKVRRKMVSFDVKQHTYREQFRKCPAFFYDCKKPYIIINNCHEEITEMENELKEMQESARIFDVQLPEFKQLRVCRTELKMLKVLWDYVILVRMMFEFWNCVLWIDIDVEQMDIDCKKLSKEIRGLDKEMRAWDVYLGLENELKNMITSLRAVGELQNPAIRERHWNELMEATKVTFAMDKETTLHDLLKLHLHKFEDDVHGIVDKAVKETSMEKTLREFGVTWANLSFVHWKHPRTGITLLTVEEEVIETLEDNQVQLQNMMTSKYIAHFLEQVSSWQQKLSVTDQVISIYVQVQRTWMHLESIFIGSEDIRRQLPDDTDRFEQTDAAFKEVAKEMTVTPIVVDACNQARLFERLEIIQRELIKCEKALAEYLETKRLAFPRFYFVSSADLLDILSNGNNPPVVAKQLTKLFDSLANLEIPKTLNAIAMYSKEGEYVKLERPCDLSGQVEVWLCRVEDSMKATVRKEMFDAVMSYEEKPRDKWLFDYPAQPALCGTQIWWTTEVNQAFFKLEEGFESAMKDYLKKQIGQLNSLITLLLGDLLPGDRQKIMTICTIDVHARDVVAKMILLKVDNSQCFLWLSQLRHRWDAKEDDCFANICDAQFRYDKEYLGNTPRLVITPLTDRCYITLTQSLHLIMGGAPAGPAGTGKTETTKDLGRALGIMVYVFNCSEQMDYKSVGNIFKGLSQSGAWGCFDEFNRIAIEVLSVIAVQVKTIQDAIRDKKKKFNFMGENIKLVPTVGAFITMNPGYAGRAELPENLKALFRPCAMVVPDFELICEIMLVAEGFLDARLLARKFITLYSLCKELLSKQDHYDWGLRAIKSVLVVAGSLKRGDRERPEDQVLMRALRDFNIPKIVVDDMPVFMGLIGDLFPALDVPRKRDPEFENNIKAATLQLRLQAEDNFILKVVQLQELFEVRHSVFILGNAGTGKSCVWNALKQTNKLLGKKPIAVDLDPKSVTNDELFGVISPATREWKDGLFSVLMRDLANMSGDGPKWIVLDGDIDPMWIESLNTVMDDNKVLTLASNERITMTRSMRLLFEISNLKTATPATVSRAGILFMNPHDIGWNPYVQSWIDRREVQQEKANLTILFDKYVGSLLDCMRIRFKKITPIQEIAHVQMLTYLLESVLTDENCPAESSKDLYELFFVFCCVWAFGGCMFQDQLCDHRVDFTKWFVLEYKTVKFPSTGTVFDYYICPQTRTFKPWTNLVPSFEFDPDLPLQATIVHTAETHRLKYFLDMLVATRRPVMLVGAAGTGKTVLTNNKLKSLNTDDYVIANVPFNFYTTSEMLQNILEKPLEKKAGRNYGPPGTKKLIYFVDDMNMPEVDKYFTVQPHTLVRACIDHAHWYDRQKLTLKEVHNVQFVSCMNPTAGSFTIDARLQRHFCVFALSLPTKDALVAIYSNILGQHMMLNNYNNLVQRYCNNLVQGAITLQTKMMTSFLPTAIKFHYIFNLRDMSNIFQGMLFANAECCKTVVHLLRLYFHEAERVYKDKLVDEYDIDMFDKFQVEIIKKNFEDQKEELVNEKPRICCHFSRGVGDLNYDFIASWPSLNKILSDVLDSYNELNAAMNLVLFEDAMSHICRINRILESPRGNALLIGVGGSGKQSLSRLAAFISGLDVFQITLTKQYGTADLKNDLNGLYKKTGHKGLGVVFLMSDAQVASEMFLVLINDLLASGEIPGLFAEDETEELINAMLNECKQLGIPDTRENAWTLFIDKVRKNLKVVLCFSPVGNTLRVRSRKFPAVTNCTSINWFHEWPEEALISVSRRFLGENELLDANMRDSISQFMAFVHKSVNEASASFLRNEHRYNYTTPKSFLEQITLYQNLLAGKNEELQASIIRLENGLEKLRSTASQVDDLKSKLASQEVELAAKNAEANELIIVVSAETEKVMAEKAIADVEEEKVSVIAVEVEQKASDCSRDLAKAEPALLAAKEALNTLNKNNLTELKSFGSPPAAVTNVTAAVMVLLAPGGNVPKDRSWKNAKATIMAKVDYFLDALINYDKDNVPLSCQLAVKPYLADPEFDPALIKSKSMAAAGLSSWVINIMRYYEVFCEVEPKRLALKKANEDLNSAQTKLSSIKAKVGALEETLNDCQTELTRAVTTKQKCQDEADATAAVIELANRLVGGLASENVRWAEAIGNFHKNELTLPGDVLLITAYVSYVGSFTKVYRTDLLENKWLPFMKKLKYPIQVTEGLDPLVMLVDSAMIASWANEGLPSDRMSTENATILTSCERWPLMIDPQLQGYKWIRTRYGTGLKIVRLEAPGYLDTIEKAVETGEVLLMENIGESVDAVLDHLLGRNTIKKGRAIRIGDKEINYHKNFKLILQTKLANPHYKPEMQAQTTIINFTVTRDGLEDQLLGAVVSKERPDLEKLKSDLTRQQNEFKIVLKGLEDNLLARLSTAEGNFLGDYALVENLETTKRTAADIEQKSEEAKITEVEINLARENYRPVAARAALLYFILNDLFKIHPMYQFSLKAFSVVFDKAIDKAEYAETESERVANLIDSITYSTYVYTTRGLFERDKLIFGTMLTFQILTHLKEIDMDALDFLLRYPATSDQASPVDFLNDLSWGGIKALSDKETFKNLDKDVLGSAKRWKKFVEGEAPEKEKFPQEWKNKTLIEKLCMMRALRPDRMSNAITTFIEESMGRIYVENRTVEFGKSFEESGPATPIFFILSPGVDPLKDVEKLGKKVGYTTAKENLHNVSLGQGQEIVAERAIDLAAKKGHWVVLQNVHLVARWLPNLEKKLEQYSEESHLNYRLFISAEPAGSREYHIIPQGILESSVKITNEPPTGMLANLHKALDNFNQDTLDMCSKEVEFKAVLFALCYFHAVVCERRKFGAQGWNRVYPFNVGDLTISVNVLYNYLEANNKVPWEDLRYLFGEIMYGGHITDDWDRKLCRTYLEVYMNQDMIDADLYLAPGFPVPPNSDYESYHLYIDEELPLESPYLYGLHPNAEIEFLTKTSDNLLRTVFEMQPHDASGGAGETVSKEDKVKEILDDLTERLPDPFNMEEIMQKVPPDERTPFVVVAFQECERMNMLTTEIRRSLKELDLGLKGELTITPEMEELSNAMFLNSVPPQWEKKAYPSLFQMAQWYGDMLQRARELDNWIGDFSLPASVWLGGFFNPQSFLTAIMQQTARKNEWPLDRMCLQCDVTKKTREEMSGPPREGAYVHGLFMEGARWDLQTGFLAESILKELTPKMPVIFLRAIPVDRVDQRLVYECPVYKTKGRGPTFVWTFRLRTKLEPSKWVLGGVALLLQV